jgi:hypothetical protein
VGLALLMGVACEGGRKAHPAPDASAAPAVADAAPAPAPDAAPAAVHDAAPEAEKPIAPEVPTVVLPEPGDTPAVDEPDAASPRRPRKPPGR